MEDLTRFYFEGTFENIASKKTELYCDPIEESHRAFLGGAWWATSFNGDFIYEGDRIFTDEKNNLFGIKEDITDKLKIKERLLKFGGHEVCLTPPEYDAKNILERGNLWCVDGANDVMMIKGEQSQCHKSSYLMWCKYNNDTDIRICTGYALSDDGLWRQHSWCVYVTNKKIKILETTEQRIAYYGYVMTTEECKCFINAI